MEFGLPTSEELHLRSTPKQKALDKLYDISRIFLEEHKFSLDSLIELNSLISAIPDSEVAV